MLQARPKIITNAIIDLSSSRHHQASAKNAIKEIKSQIIRTTNRKTVRVSKLRKIEAAPGSDITPQIRLIFSPKKALQGNLKSKLCRQFQEKYPAKLLTI